MSNIFSYLISIYFIVRGFMHFGQGNTGMGAIYMVIGLGGLIYKIYEAQASKNHIDFDDFEEEKKEENPK